MSVIDTLITDRTQADVDRIVELKNKIMLSGLAALTQEEQTEYFGNAKGSYNATDLNRVGEACNYLYNLFTQYGYTSPSYVTQKTDWQYSDTINVTNIGTYLNSLSVLKSLLNASQNIPQSAMFLTYQEANNIEKLLQQLNNMLNSMILVFMRAGSPFAFANTNFYFANGV